MDEKELWDAIKSEGCLSPGLREEIIRVHGERGRKALQALDEGQVKRYRDFVVVVGTSGEYIVEEEFCTCQDFLFRGKSCWHLLAARLAALCGGWEVYDLWYQETWPPVL
jgi:predicted nucleic acid-binding Zn finger protein